MLSLMEYIKTAYRYEVDNVLSATENARLNTLLSKLLEEYKVGKPER